MNKKVNAKLVIATLSLGIIMLASIVSIVLILASSRQELSSNITVSFVSNNVSATVDGAYYVAGSEEKLPMGSSFGGDNKTITFGASDVTKQEQIVPLDSTGNVVSNIELSANNDYVVFEYKFTNLSSTAGFTVELLSSPKIQEGYAVENSTSEIGSHSVNMTEKYYVTKNEVSASALGGLINRATAESTFSVKPILAGENNTLYVYVIAKITNSNDDALYNGTYYWQLNFINPSNLVDINVYESDGVTLSNIEAKALKLNDGKSYYMPTLSDNELGSNLGAVGLFDSPTGGERYYLSNGDPAHTFELEQTNDEYALYEHEIFEFTSNALTGLTDEALDEPNLVIPSGVTSISADAFSGNTNLISVTLPSTVTSVGDEAFKDCTSLREVTIPGTTTLSGNNIFSGCDNISITAPIYSKALLSGATGVNLIMNGTATNLSNQAFIRFNGLVSVDISDGLLTIGKDAFLNCTYLKVANIPYGVTSIGTSAFSGCSKLAEVNIPETVVTVGIEAFLGTKITSIVIPDSVTSIGSQAFQSCNSLRSVTIGNGVTVLSQYLFRYSKNIETIILGNSVTTIEYGVFYQCESLTTLTFPASVANIYPVQFYRSGITDLIFQDITSTWTISTEENGAGDIIDNNWQPTNDTEANRSKFTSNVFRNYYFTKN